MADIPISGLVESSASLAVDLTSSAVGIAGVVAAAAALTVAGQLGEINPLAGSVQSSAALTVAGVRIPHLSGQVDAVASLLSSLTAIPPLRGRLQADASLTVSAIASGQGLTVQEVVQDVLALWGQGCCGTPADPCLHDAIILRLNASLQTIWSQAHQLDFFNRTTLTLTVPASQTSVAVPENVQNLLGPVRLADSRIPLTQIRTESEFDGFIDFYYAGIPPSTIRAYHLESLNQASGDNVALTLKVAPAPAEDTALLVDVSTEPPRYTVADIARGTPIEIPHRYAESLLLPLVRKWATGHRLFTRREMQPQIDEQFSIAQSTLGLITPDPKPTNKP